MSELSEAEAAFLASAGERLKDPFRPAVDVWELKRDRESWQSRKATVNALQRMLGAAHHLDDALSGFRQQPQGPLNEIEADRELQALWAAVQQLFGPLQPKPAAD